MTRLNGLGLPSAVLYSLKAMGAGMIAAVADGPLPIGDILLAAATASTVAIIAANWNAVAPKFNQITGAFQAAFSTMSSNVSVAFAKIKNDSKNASNKNNGNKSSGNKSKKPSGNKSDKPTGRTVRDVQQRLRKDGFELLNQEGSHQKWRKGDMLVSVPNHGPGHELRIGTLRSIWKQARWI